MSEPCKTCDGDGWVPEQYENGEFSRTLAPCPDCSEPDCFLVPAWHDSPTCAGKWFGVSKHGSTVFTEISEDEAAIGALISGIKWRWFGPVPKDDQVGQLKEKSA